MPKGIYIRTEEMNRSMSLATKGHRVSEETKKKMSLNHIGMSGKCHSKETKRKMSVIRKGKSNGRQGKSYSEETKKKMSFAHQGKNNHNFGKRLSEKTKKKMSLVHRGIHHSEETKQKLREIRLGKVTPGFNTIACQIINEYGKKYGYHFQHALNGGEFRVIGYALDGYDKKKNVVIEYYENRHRSRWRKDLVRQRRIMKHLGCKFIILKEWEI